MMTTTTTTTMTLAILLLLAFSVQAYGQDVQEESGSNRALDAIFGPSPSNESLAPNFPMDKILTPEEHQQLQAEIERRSNLAEQERQQQEAQVQSDSPRGEETTSLVEELTSADYPVEWKTFTDREALFTVEYAPYNMRPVAVPEEEKAGPIDIEFVVNAPKEAVEELDAWGGITFTQYAEKSVYNTAREELQSVITANIQDPGLTNFEIIAPLECEIFTLNGLPACSYGYHAISPDTGSWWGLEVEAVAADGTDYNAAYLGNPQDLFLFYLPDVKRMIESFKTSTPPDMAGADDYARTTPPAPGSESEVPPSLLYESEIQGYPSSPPPSYPTAPSYPADPSSFDSNMTTTNETSTTITNDTNNNIYGTDVMNATELIAQRNAQMESSGVIKSPRQTACEMGVVEFCNPPSLKP